MHSYILQIAYVNFLWHVQVELIPEKWLKLGKISTF